MTYSLGLSPPAAVPALGGVKVLVGFESAVFVVPAA
jgi:hypothetical protein